MSDRLRAVLGQKCPRCLQGRVFPKGIRMYEYCPVCHLKFEREQGYFLGAMYVAFAIALPILVLFALLVWLSTKLSLDRIILVAGALFAPFTPLVFRYSRVVWMHLDYLAEPW